MNVTHPVIACTLHLKFGQRLPLPLRTPQTWLTQCWIRQFKVHLIGFCFRVTRSSVLVICSFALWRCDYLCDVEAQPRLVEKTMLLRARCDGHQRGSLDHQHRSFCGQGSKACGPLRSTARGSRTRRHRSVGTFILSVCAVLAPAYLAQTAGAFRAA